MLHKHEVGGMTPLTHPVNRLLLTVQRSGATSEVFRLRSLVTVARIVVTP
jgi:hypothetical protein